MTYNIESELYKKFFQLFINDADGKYMNSSVSPKIDEDELDEETHDDPNVLDQNLKNDINELKEFIKDGIKNGSIEVGYLNYSYITQQIYSGDTVKNNSFEFITKLKKNYLDKSDESKVIFKLLRHTDLALVQKASLSDKIVELESRVKKEVEKSGNLTKELEDTTKKLENIAKKWEEELNDTKEEMKKIMPEIIGIMGVFSTIIFAVFSGFNEITTLGQSLSSTPISKVMIYIGSSFIVLIGIV
ncbi:hypothetical protein, partial [Streptococcus orisratti]|uniref:hypothetical protein n=1 Tax=Streptococcus orisratti TaxID=114652 RepID=UPI00294375FB